MSGIVIHIAMSRTRSKLVQRPAQGSTWRVAQAGVSWLPRPVRRDWPRLDARPAQAQGGNPVSSR
jgi:hypothetical protein